MGLSLRSTLTLSAQLPRVGLPHCVSMCCEQEGESRHGVSLTIRCNFSCLEKANDEAGSETGGVVGRNWGCVDGVFQERKDTSLILGSGCFGRLSTRDTEWTYSDWREQLAESHDRATARIFTRIMSSAATTYCGIPHIARGGDSFSTNSIVTIYYWLTLAQRVFDFNAHDNSRNPH